jgi:asparagine synthase (glutamine-hydrolysing)
MCGILGWILEGKNRQDRATLVDLTDVMKHRGPDGCGYWLGDTVDGNHQVALGHRRLSIIDISCGSQPMWSSAGDVGVVFNGEIYNYIELRRELEALGHGFRTASDTEVLIEAYRAWGADAIGKFRGMFAFALWDIRKQSLLLARDPYGKKPLFIAQRRGAILFASEIEPLVRFPGFDRSLDPTALDHYLLNRYVPGPLTFFRGVRKLLPGHHGIWRDGRLEVTRYFTPPFATVEPDISCFDDAECLFRETFDEAVRIRMRSDAPFGAYLSGGIDSSAVVAAMVKHASGPVRTFSVGFREAAYSELDHARVIANLFGTEHRELVVEPDAFMAHWSTAVLRRGAPVSEASDIPIFMLSEAASRSVKMVLTGEGSDELLGGYPKHRAEAWVSLYQKAVPPVLHRHVVAPAARALPYGMRRVKILALAAGERSITDRMRVWFGGLSIDEHQSILGRSCRLDPPDPSPFSARIGSSMRRTLLFDQTSWLPDNLLERGDRMMMAGSIEGRMPFMDTVLAGVVARFPDSFLVAGKGGKRILRSTMRKSLPPEILTRKKIGFRVPFNAWFRGAYREVVREMLVSRGSRVAQMCDGATIRRLVQEHISGRQNNERVLWSLTNLELFLREFKLSGVDAAEADAA